MSATVGPDVVGVSWNLSGVAMIHTRILKNLDNYFIWPEYNREISGFDGFIEIRAIVCFSLRYWDISSPWEFPKVQAWVAKAETMFLTQKC